MRDIALFVIVFGAIPYILRHPYIGVLVWSWLSYMNPHRLAWGLAYDFPFAQLVAITLFISLLLDKESKRLPRNGLVVVWILFILWGLVATLNAFDPDYAMFQYIKLIKIQLIIFLAMLIMHGAERIKLMVWVIFLSIGFYGIKGGVFTILTGGGARVWGPPGSFIEDNNHLAVALLMIIPLGYYLIRHELSNKWLRLGMWAGLLSISFAIVGSYSRGAFIAIICVAFYLWLKSDKKIMTMIVLLPLLPMLFLFMPDTWHERMASIQNYEQDASAMGRINAWHYSVNVANDRVTGVGIGAWSTRTFAIWAPDPTDVHAAHSIYFSVIADFGWIGFGLFFIIFMGGFLLARRVSKVAARHDEFKWASDLAKMIQVSLVAYGTGGAFLSLSYFDLPWHLVAIILLLQEMLKREGVWATKPQPFVRKEMPATQQGS